MKKIETRNKEIKKLIAQRKILDSAIQMVRNRRKYKIPKHIFMDNVVKHNL